MKSYTEFNKEVQFSTNLILKNEIKKYVQKICKNSNKKMWIKPHRKKKDGEWNCKKNENIDLKNHL